MATIETGIVSYLQSYSGLTSLISNRVYLMYIPQSATLPCLVYSRVSTPRELTHDTSGSAGALAHSRFQFDAWDESYSSVKSITDQVRAALNGKSGSIGSGGNAVTIRASLVDEESPEYNPETNLYRSRSEYIIWHEE